MDGWIKLHRKMLDWEWYNDNNTKIVFLHLLLTANHKEKKWQGTTIKRGQKLTSLQHLAEDTNLSTQQVRTALDKLKSTNEITTKSTNKNTLITIEKYSDYQDKDEENNNQDNKIDNKQITNEQQTNNKRITTNKNDKNEKNEKNEKNKKNKYGEYKNVLLTDKEFEKIQDEYNNYEELIKYLDEYIEMKGYKAKSHYLCIKRWVVDAVKNVNKITKVNKKTSNFEQREYDDLSYLYMNGG